MFNKRRRLALGVAVATIASLGLVGPAMADPNNAAPGTPPTGRLANEIYAAQGADAFAELANNFVSLYNAQAGPSARVLASYDAINPLTGVAGETIVTKPGCTTARINGANGALTAIKLNTKSTVDTAEYCLDYVRASRAKAANGSESTLTFYAQSRDAVGYAVVGNAYAPTTPLTSAQLKGIFECDITDWSDVGGQAGPIHVYFPPDSAATLTFFLQGAGTTLDAVKTGCGAERLSQQQNDGRSLDGDPQGIAPYAVTKWAAQSNEAPGIPDWRGGSHIGLINTTATPTITTTLSGTPYEVLNPAFTSGASTGFGRLFFNAVRNDAPADLKAVFSTAGYLCTNQDALLIPFGNTPLGSNTSATNYCGQES